MLITAQILKNLKACKSQIKAFSQVFPDGCETEQVENLYLAEEKGLDIPWAIDKRLVLKQVCLGNPCWAYYYALYVDRQPKGNTRLAACKDPEWAYYYALNVDKQPRDDTRLAACKNPYRAYCYAYNIDEQPRDDTRLATCGDPQWAYWYALYIDKQSRNDTRLAACEDPYWADCYAHIDVDNL